MSPSLNTHSVQQSLLTLVGWKWINTRRRSSIHFGFYISFSKFQGLGIAGVVERVYLRTDTLEAVRLRGKRLKKLTLLLGSVTVRECQFVLLNVCLHFFPSRKGDETNKGT